LQKNGFFTAELINDLINNRDRKDCSPNCSPDNFDADMSEFAQDLLEIADKIDDLAAHASSSLFS